MRRLGSTNRSSASSSPSRLRTALETVLLPNDEETVVEECRRCGTTRESDGRPCPTCGCDGVARYRIE